MAFAIQPMFRRRPIFRFLFTAMLACMVLVGAPGCSLIFPDISHEPVVHNPFPQLNKVAVAPFFNQSNEPTVDGFAAEVHGALIKELRRIAWGRAAD